jgi:hypothetical protein
MLMRAPLMASEAILVRDRGELSNHADLEAEKIGQDWCQPLEGDALGEAQIDDAGAQVRSALRRAGGEPGSGSV